MTTETWRVIDDKGAVHNVNVGRVRDSTAWRAWVGAVGGAVVHDDARGAVVLAAMRDGVDIAEVLAPGQAPRAQAIADAFGRGADLQRGLIRAFAVSADPAEIDAVMAPAMPDDLGAEVPARRLLDGVRDALGPTCADATHEALPGLVAEVVACDAAMHCEVDARGERLREMTAEVAHLEARRGALLAEVDRLTAALREVARG